MALVLADRVLETTTTTGSGTITLAGAEPGYQSFSAVGNGNQTYYTITADTVWEVGIGTYTASGTTLSRDTVLSSSASGAKVTLPSGVKKVFVTYPSEKSVNFGVSGNISASSGVITDVGYPSAASDAATKLYVDTLAAQGITYHTPVKYEVPDTTGNLNATYNNGTAGVSATLTNAGTLGPFVPDGVTASISDRILVYNQTNGFENGVYTVTTVGTGASSWVLTRASDADTYALKSPNGLGQGDAFYVTSGNTGAGETYLCNTSGTITFGTTPINFVQISAAQVYSAGTGISLTNTTISLVSPVAVATGGTGLTSTPTNGQLLIGNGSGYTLSTLTAGSGVSITNSAGSITLTATGTGGTVVAVTATAPLASTGGVSPNISIANTTGTGSVVLDQGATISSATITAGVSAAITTITGTSANITTVTGTTAGFSSANISTLSSTSANITTLTGTSATITTITGTSSNISTLSSNSANITTLSSTNANFTSATITNLALTSITLSNLSVSSANITTLTGSSMNVTTATHASSNITTLSGTTLTYASGTITNLNATSLTLSNLSIASANITTLTGTSATITTIIGTSSNITTLSSTSANITTLTGTNFTASSLNVSNNIGLTSTGAPGITKTYSARVDVSAGGLGNPFWQGWHFATPDVIIVSGSNTFPRTSLYNTYSTATNPTDLAFAIMPGNNGAGNYALILGANGAEQVRVTATGVGIGGTAQGNVRVHALGDFAVLSGNANSTAFGATGTVPTSITSTARSFYSSLTTAASFTLSNLYHFAASNVNVGAGATVTNQIGFIAQNGLTTATNNYGFYSDIASGSNRWNFYAAGTAQNYFEGNVGIGKSPTTKLDVSGTITGTAVSATNISATSITVTNTPAFVGNGTLTMAVSGTGLSGSASFTANQSGNSTFTVTSNATSANTASTIVARDASGNFSAGTITATLNGNASTVTNGLYTTGNQTITARNLQQGGQSSGSMLTATGSLGGLELYGGGGANAAFMTFHRPGAYASYFGIDTDNNFAVGGWSAGAALAAMKVGFFGVGTAASGTAGEIRATNNVTAYYSDARLKDFKGKIDGALDKVSQLNGYYYTENAKAEEFGYNNKAMQVGVSAQEVKAVLPEIVTAAPFDIAKDEDGNEISKSGENYMTVRYERLVPLLIEAIKELKAEVEALKAAK